MSKLFLVSAKGLALPVLAQALTQDAFPARKACEWHSLPYTRTATELSQVLVVGLEVLVGKISHSLVSDAKYNQLCLSGRGHEVSVP
jgi:hypothetical protein